jgi:sugar phosphate isomerase/epimerase
VKPLALSTMFAQQERFADGAEFARFAQAAGYQAIEISHSTPIDKMEQIRLAGVLPINSVHQPAPWIRRENGRGNSSANLAAIDEVERRAAIEYTRLSIEWAGKVGARRVVVHLGQVSTVHEQFEDELAMRKLFDAGDPDEGEMSRLRDAARARRDAEAEPFLAAARRSLDELVRMAEPFGVTIGLENRYHFHEIPGPDEYARMFEGYTIEQVGYWHDTGHAEVLHRLGFIDREVWLNKWSSRLVGAHLHDVQGIGDHRAPGDGDVDWGYIVRGIQHLPAYTLEINQHRPDESVTAAPAFLERIGLR